MDVSRFDSLTRFLSKPGNRRGALGWLAASLGLLGLSDAEAGNRNMQKKRKRKRKKRKKNVCAGKNTCAEAAFPRTVASCEDCLAGETCVDLDGPGVPCNFAGLACVTRCPNGK